MKLTTLNEAKYKMPQLLGSELKLTIIEIRKLNIDQCMMYYVHSKKLQQNNKEL